MFWVSSRCWKIPATFYFASLSPQTWGTLDNFNLWTLNLTHSHLSYAGQHKSYRMTKVHNSNGSYDKFFHKHKPFCKRKKLESLNSLLLDASIVVRPSHTFLSCLIITTSNTPITDEATSSLALISKHSPILCCGHKASEWSL